MPKFWKFNKINNSSSEAELLLYGPISETSWWGDEVTPKQFAEDLKKLGEVTQINIRINSPGGDVFAAQAIHSMLKRHSANKTVYIDGLAASAATIVALVGKTIMPKNAMFMIHNPWTISWGNANEMRDVADLLDKVRETIVNVYEEKTQKDRADLIKLMDEETWMTATEALEMGFVDEIETSLKVAACIKDNKLFVNGLNFDIDKFKNLEKLGLERMQVKTESLNKNKMEEKQVENLTIEILQKENPELLAQIKDASKKEGVEAERERLKAIDDLNIKGHDELVAKAKYEKGSTVEQLSFEVVKAEKLNKTEYLANLNNDASLLSDVSSTDTTKKTDKTNDLANKIAEGANSLRK